MNQQRFALLMFITTLLFGAVSQAAPLDKSANKKITEAINVHYLATDFKKAESILTGTIDACGERCSSKVLARAWMYVGIVRGAGLQDITGAEEAFLNAVTLDPDVGLDKDLATDEVQQAFENAGGDLSKKAGVPPPEAEGASPVPIASGEGTMECTPVISEVDVRRPIPVACQTSVPAKSARVFFKGFGAPSWSQVNLSQSGSDWLGIIPCSATALQGELQWFVVALGEGGQPVASTGSEQVPNVIQIVQSSSDPPPTHPGQPPPERCMDASDCPEEMRGTPSCPDPTMAAGGGRGTKGWGAGCDSHKECEAGLYCLAGSCESPPACETGADCDSGLCENSTCVILEEGDAAPGDGPENFIGFGVGFDLTSLSGEYMCNPSPAVISNGTIVAAAEPSKATCLIGDDLVYESNPFANNTDSGAVGSTFATGTIRLYLTFEHIFSGKFGVEGQGGLAIAGSPLSDTSKLLHLAAFGKYWFDGTGPGFRFYGTVGGGLGQVDARTSITVTEPFDPATADPNVTPGEAERAALYTPYCVPVTPGVDYPCQITPVNAWRSFGQVFLGAGVGGLINLGTVGVDVRLIGKFMVPESAFVIQPTAGMVYGF